MNRAKQTFSATITKAANPDVSGEALPPPLDEIAVMTSERRQSQARRKSAGSDRRRSNDRMAAARSRDPRPAPGEVVVGTFVGLSELGEPLVDHPLNAEAAPVPARSTIPLAQDDIGRQIVLAFEAGDVRRPIVMGAVCSPFALPHTTTTRPSQRLQPPLEVQHDGERLIFSAEQEIVLKCGGASITLTRAGKILIRGTYLLSRSSGVNRIKGGSVQIN